MDVFEAIKKRYSCRSYKDTKIRKEDLEQILEAARLAPSARNFQEWRFVVVQDKQTRETICKEAAKGREFIAQAPVIIVCCANITDYIMTCGQPAYPIDVAIAIDHMSFAATELGIASCWIGAFFEDKLKKILNIPDEIRVVDLLLLGYAADERPEKKPRLKLSEIVKYESW